RAEGFDLPFILVSGTLGDEAAVECMKRGVTDYVFKERLSRLPSAVERALEEKRLRQERARAEAALRKSEQRFRVLLESAADAILGVTPEGRIGLVNVRAEKMFGYSREELLGQSVEMLVPEPLREAYGIHREKYISAPHTRPMGAGLDLMARRKDGSEFPVEISLSPAEMDEGFLVTTIVRDVSERKKAEQALRESQRTLSTLMSNLPGMVYRCRPGEDRRLEFASEGCRELTGYPPSDLIGNRKSSYGRLIHPDDRRAVREGIEAGIRGRKPFQLVYRIGSAAGVEKWVWEQGRGVFSSQGRLEALEGFVADISERRALEQRFQHAQKTEAVGQLAAGVPDESLPQIAPAESLQTVMVVDDDDPLRKLTREVFELEGYRVMEAGSGSEALKLSESHSGTIDVLVTDVVMPGMNGLDLARKLIGFRPGLRVLYVSGYTDGALSDLTDLPKDAFLLQKPFSLDVLIRKVREVLDLRGVN
ncbi:MAG: PAS domain S-box protein, partial [Acidobacteria bacterium]|nr:PAS domain S-box protein [Acidobacteriota bacterium]